MKNWIATVCCYMVPMFVPGLFLLIGVEMPSPLAAQTDELGSTITLEDLKAGIRRRAQPRQKAFPKPEVIKFDPIPTVSSALLPTPLLRYRFAPHPRDLRPGNAYLRYSRAVILMPDKSSEAMAIWNDFQASHEENEMPVAAEIAKQLAPFQSTLDELNDFVRCEDLTYDLRLRDIDPAAEGLARLYGTLLPGVAEARSLARLLRYRCSQQLQERDFVGAFHTIQIGYRLAKLLRNGETLVEQLSAIAIEGIMQGCVKEAIQTPGCPNCYYALATLPDLSRQLIRAIELEVSVILEFLPILKTAEQVDWDHARWQTEWGLAIRHLSADLLKIDPNSLLAAQLLLFEIGGGDRAKRELIAAGEDRDKVESMCDEQAIAIQAARDLRKISDLITAPLHLPIEHSGRLLDESSKAMEQWRSKQPGSFAATIAELQLPAVSQIFGAERRTRAIHNQLMTVEAVRDYAAHNHNRLPRTLDDVGNVPVMIDPFANRPVRYEIKSDELGEYAEFSFEGPQSLPEEMRIMRLRIGSK